MIGNRDRDNSLTFYSYPHFSFSMVITIFILFIPAFPGISADVVIADAVRLECVANPAIVYITDDSDPNFFITGSWNNSAYPGGYLNTYKWATVSDLNPGAAYWKFDVETPGDYDVSLYYVASTNRYSAAHLIIQHSGGVAELSIDQKTGGLWEPLGTYHFSPGTYFVQLSSSETSAVLQSIVIDNGDLLFKTEGSWTQGTLSPGYEDDYLYTMCSATSTSQAIWDIPVFKYQAVEKFSTPSLEEISSPKLKITLDSVGTERRSGPTKHLD